MGKIAPSPWSFPSNSMSIVVGGGHAGTEAALAGRSHGLPHPPVDPQRRDAGQMVVQSIDRRHCKGHLVKEIDALGGAMALATDEAGIQFRTLNSSKGRRYGPRARKLIGCYTGRPFADESRTSPICSSSSRPWMTSCSRDSGWSGSQRSWAHIFHAQAVVLTTGTFLGGLIHVGCRIYQAGRAGDPLPLRSPPSYEE